MPEGVFIANDREKCEMTEEGSVAAESFGKGGKKKKK